MCSFAKGWGSHHNSYPVSYLTAAASIGMDWISTEPFYLFDKILIFIVSKAFYKSRDKAIINILLLKEFKTGSIISKTGICLKTKLTFPLIAIVLLYIYQYLLK